MSTSATATSVAVPKRGRPKKAVIEEMEVAAGGVEEAKKMGTRKASTSTKAAKGEGEKKVAVKKEKVAKVAKSTKSTTKAAKATKTATTKKAEVKPVEPAPVTPSTSKILQEVAATGTLKKMSETLVEAAKPATSIPKASSVPPQPSAPAKPTTTPISSSGTAATSKPPPTPSAPTTKPTPTPTPTIKPTSTTKAKPTSKYIPIVKPTPAPPTTRTTTIPLPSHPKTPILPYRPPQANPALAPGTTPTPKPPQTVPYAGLEPNLPPPPDPKARLLRTDYDGKIDKKYKWASRRVTAIIVSLPIVIVLGWELFQRYNGNRPIRKKYEEAETPRPGKVGFGRPKTMEAPVSTSSAAGQTSADGEPKFQ